MIRLRNPPLIINEEQRMRNKEYIKQGIEKKLKKIEKILYVNVNGIGDKVISLKSPSQLAQADIVSKVETKSERIQKVDMKRDR